MTAPADGPASAQREQRRCPEGLHTGAECMSIPLLGGTYAVLLREIAVEDMQTRLVGQNAHRLEALADALDTITPEMIADIRAMVKSAIIPTHIIPTEQLRTAKHVADLLASLATET